MPAQVQNLFCGYFVGLKFLAVGTSWVQEFFLCPFLGSKISSRGYIMNPKIFLVGLSRVQIFSRKYFVGTRENIREE